MPTASGFRKTSSRRRSDGATDTGVSPPWRISALPEILVIDRRARLIQLGWCIAAVSVSVAPHLSRMPVWINGLTAACIAWRLLAALRGGIKTVLIPKDNVKDLPEIPDNVKDGLEIIPVETVTKVLELALVRQPEPIEWDEDESVEEAPIVEGESDGPEASLAH